MRRRPLVRTRGDRRSRRRRDQRGARVVAETRRTRLRDLSRGRGQWRCSNEGPTAETQAARAARCRSPALTNQPDGLRAIDGRDHCFVPKRCGRSVRAKWLACLSVIRPAPISAQLAGDRWQRAVSARGLLRDARLSRPRPAARRVVLDEFGAGARGDGAFDAGGLTLIRPGPAASCAWRTGARDVSEMAEVARVNRRQIGRKSQIVGHGARTEGALLAWPESDPVPAHRLTSADAQPEPEDGGCGRDGGAGRKGATYQPFCSAWRGSASR